MLFGLFVFFCLSCLCLLALFNLKLTFYLLLSGLMSTSLKAHTFLQLDQEADERQAYVQACQSWQQSLRNPHLLPRERFDLLTRLGVAQQKLGNLAIAQQHLQDALSLAKQQHWVSQQALLHSYLANLLLRSQAFNAAHQHLTEGISLTQQPPQISAHLHNNLGNLLAEQQKYTQAVQTYVYAQDFAVQAEDDHLHQQISLNLAHTYLDLKQFSQVQKVLQISQQQIMQTIASARNIPLILKLVHLLLKLYEKQLSEEFLQQAEQVLHHLYITKTEDNAELNAYVYAHLATIYQHRGQPEIALSYIRKAIFLSQQQATLLYLWEWQRGQILQAQQDWEGAMQAYAKAKDYLMPVQFELLQYQQDVSGFFYEQLYPIYTSLLDVQLYEAAQTLVPKKKQKILYEALDVLETLRTVELQHYFKDPCFQKEKLKHQKTYQLPPQTAVLYPLILPQRLELLLLIDGQLYQYTQKLEHKRLTQVINQFQRHLQTRSRWKFVTQARQLYDWLIAPLHKQLEDNQIHTLIMVPDGALRLIPLAALTDGRQFLVEKFALAVSPSLRLTDIQTHSPNSLNILLAGLSTNVQGFSALPNVLTEVKQIQQLFKRNTTLLNQDFQLENFSQALQKESYSVVHVASHGRFEQDHRQTFFLTFEEKVSMNQFQELLRDNHKRNGNTLELLTLSACQTALGDERAALGLAGVALKAGARSALASLWYINDEATAELLVEFYRQLQKPHLSKAQALQNAQKSLIHQRHLRHPVYWSPFLLIGNWL